MDSVIREKVWMPVGGIQQGAFISGPSRDHPVLLFLHGGPGLPEHALLERYPSRLDEDVVVCWWEQRGAGLSYRASRRAGPITEERLVRDTLEVADWLRERFDKDRIYLMAHSGGTHVGIQAAARAPDRFHAYVGMAQMTRQLESERLAWIWMREQFEQAGDRGTVRRLDRHPMPKLDAIPRSYRGLRDTAMHRLGVGTTREMRSVVSGVFVPTLTNSRYSIRERIDIWRGKWSEASKDLFDEMVARDITTVVPRLDLPVHLVHGVFDRTVSYDLAREYLSALEAPLKGFYTFPESAHSPFLEEPDRLQHILREDVLRGRIDLADHLPCSTSG